MIDIPIDLSNEINPDHDAIIGKLPIDISLSVSDISASLATGSLPVAAIKTGYTQQRIVLVDDNDPTTVGDAYYTPVYIEKISYAEWKVRVNKTFFELGAE